MTVDMYTVGLCAMTVMFGLMVGLTVILIRDQSALSARQQVLESRTGIELESFRDQVKAMKRVSEAETEAGGSEVKAETGTRAKKEELTDE